MIQNTQFGNDSDVLTLVHVRMDSAADGSDPDSADHQQDLLTLCALLRAGLTQHFCA